MERENDTTERDVDGQHSEEGGNSERATVLRRETDRHNSEEGSGVDGSPREGGRVSRRERLNSERE